MIKFTKLTLFALTALSHGFTAGATNTIEWKTLEQTLPYPVSDMTATLIPGRKKTDDDTILIAGGCSSKNGNEKLSDDESQDDFYCMEVTDEMYSFNVRTKKFTKLKNMPQKRYRHAAVAIYGKLYIVGGRDVEDNLIGEVIVYDPLSNEWSQVRVLPDDFLVSDNAAFAYEGRLYVLGGYGKDYDTKSFMIDIDLATGDYTKKQSMPTARGDASAVSYEFADGKTIGYMIGGFTHENDWCAPLADAEVYDFVTDTWTEIKDMNYKRGDKAVVVHNGRIVAIGGESKHEEKCQQKQSGDAIDEVGSGSELVDSVEYYDPRDSVPMWRQETKLEEHRFRAAAASVKSTGSVFVFGGQSLFTESCNCYPTSDTIYEYIEMDDTSSVKNISAFGACALCLSTLFYLFFP